MQLSVEEVAHLLNISADTVYRLIDEGDIPVHRVNKRLRFSRAELLEWAAARRIRLAPQVVPPSATTIHAPGLAEALQAGGVVRGVFATDSASLLEQVVDCLPLARRGERDFLLPMLLAENPFSATRDGILIPQMRRPLVLSVARPTLTLLFLKVPVPSGGTPARTLFMLVSPTVRIHMMLLSQLTGALADPVVRTALDPETPNKDIVAAFAIVDARDAADGKKGTAVADGTHGAATQ